MKMRLNSFTLVVLVMLGIFLILYWVFVIPEFRDLAGQQQQLEQLLGSTSAITKQSSSSAQDARKRALAELKTEAEGLLPLTDQQYDLSVQLEAAAKGAGLAISALTVNAPDLGIPLTTAGAAAAANTSNVPRVGFTMGVSGTYSQVRHWVTNLVSFDRFVQLDQVAVTSKATNDDPDQVIAQVTGFAYYLPASTTTP